MRNYHRSSAAKALLSILKNVNERGVSVRNFEPWLNM